MDEGVTVMGVNVRLAAYILSPFVVVAICLSLVRIYTTWNYHRALKYFVDPPHAGQNIVKAPQIPYTLPWLGNTLSFLTTRPGAYWEKLLSWHPRSTGVCTLLIGGQRSHILFAPSAIQALFRNRSITHDVFNRDLFTKVFCMAPAQVDAAISGVYFEHELNKAYLVKHGRVDELTAHFMKVLDALLAKDTEELDEQIEFSLFLWLRAHMFKASTTALMGDGILRMYPEWSQDMFQFDNDFLSFFFELPKFMMGTAFQNRDRIFDNLKAWNKEMHRQSGGVPIDPEGPAWEPLLGSRLNRARHLHYKQYNFDWHTSAAFDLGINFALASNVIPATGWMLFHILDPNASKELYPRVMAELTKAENRDGTVDVPTLVASPLLQSIWTEVLRLYSDFLLARNLTEDLVVPLDEDGKRSVLMRKGDNIFAPSWLGHRHAETWSKFGTDSKIETVPYDVFDPDRFITTDPENGQEAFTMSGTTGKYFPFGGGTTICPGRVFAKQEALGAVAMVLLRFKFDAAGFVDGKQKATENFPTFAKAFAGSGALLPGGDIKVRMRRRVPPSSGTGLL